MRPRALSVLAIAASAAIAVGYLSYNIWFVFDTPGLPGDLANHVRIIQQLEQGPVRTAAGDVQQGNVTLADFGYPPWSLQFHRLLVVIPDTDTQVLKQEVFFVFLSLLAIGYTAFWSYGRLKTHDRSVALVLALLSAGVFANAVALRVGQFSSIVLALTLLSTNAFAAKRNVWAGALLAASFMKPHMTLYNVVPFLLQRRWVALLAFAAVIGGTSIATLYQLNLDPWTLGRTIVQGTSQTSPQWSGARYGILHLLFEQGAPHGAVVFGSLAVGGILCVLLVRRIPTNAPLAAFAVCSTLSALFVYHRRYDFMMLWILVIALVDAYFIHRKRSVLIAAIVVTGTLLLPLPEKIFVRDEVYYFLMGTWLVAALVLASAVSSRGTATT